MLHAIRFTKASGAGNDFVIASALDQTLPDDRSRLARCVCDRHFGVGADGLLVMDPSAAAEFRMSYYNADGSHGGMCGNGGRCIARFASEAAQAPARVRFEALDHIYEARVDGERVSLHMKDPSALRPVLGLEAMGRILDGVSVDTGSPHFVVFLDDLDTLDVEATGRVLRHHAAFQPAGTNVNFVRVAGADTITVRTYERGVERETLACGTGSIASAVVAIDQRGVKSPVRVSVRSGEDLIVAASRGGGKFREIFLEGTAHMLFSGALLYDDELGTVHTPPRGHTAAVESR